VTRPDPTLPQALRACALQWQASGTPVVAVTVTATQGSVPREAGTRMLVTADALRGTIGGGQLEHAAIADARALLLRTVGNDGREDMRDDRRHDMRDDRHGAAAPLVQRIALGPSLGQCCGGVVHLRIALLADDPPAAWPSPPSLFSLQLYGAGHVGRAIVRLLAHLPCEVAWIDERDSEFPSTPLPPHIQRVCVEPVEAEVPHAAPGSFYLVLTHSHALDLAVTRAILARGDFGYFGLIGSATKRAKFEARLRERGVADAMLARITCPIGIEGVRGKAPEIIAVGVVAQLLQRAGA